MNRPVLEVADLVRAAGDAFIERSCVCGRPQAGRDGQLRFEGDLTRLAQPKIFARPLATPVPKGLDRLLEATLLWPIVRGAISRPLHPLRGYLQPSPDLVC